MKIVRPIKATFSDFMRFLTKVEDYSDSTKCWNWTGGYFPRGYGKFHIKSEAFYAHRISYTTLIGIIPEDLILDHLCRNVKCVNPWHLEPVTPGENVRRGDSGKREAARTHCPHGHEYNLENTFYKKTATCTKRECRACDRERHRRQVLRRKDPSVPYLWQDRVQ
jgi:hypothetical protein